MKTLLIVAHGSRREQSNQEIHTLAEKVGANVPDDIDDVSVAFLEFAEPTITQSVARCFEQGADEIVLLPYFLSSGNHVVKDIPNVIEPVLAQWPTKKITTLPHIGAANDMITLITRVCHT